MVEPNERLLIHASQASPNEAAAIAWVREDTVITVGLLWQTGAEIHCTELHACMAKFGDWDRHRLHIFSYPVVSIHELNCLVYREDKGWMRVGVRQPPVRAFMDMNVTTKTIIEAKWTLKDIKDIFNWARMKIYSMKSRGLVLKNGRIGIGEPRRGLQIMDTRMGFPCPFRSEMIDYFSPHAFIFNK